MAITVEGVLAGPILRRVEPTHVSVWLALRTEATVELQIWKHPDPTGDNELLGQAPGVAVRVGEGLCIVIATVEFAATAALLPETIYGYDLVIDGKTLGDLGLLSDETKINGHEHRALGYRPGHRPSFATAPRDVKDLVTFHTSCRLLYSTGHDAMVSLDRLISDGGVDWRKRPHQLFLTGDQIYADNVAPEMLRWLTREGVRFVSGTNEVKETLRVDIDLQEDETETVASFPVDELHFPPGRRAYLCSIAGGLTSQDSTSHVLGLGEYIALYLFGWSNVLWPAIADGDWKALHKQRGHNIKEFKKAWKAVLDDRDQAITKKRERQPKFSPPKFTDERLEMEAGWHLVPAPLRAIDRFLKERVDGAQRNPDLVELWEDHLPAADDVVKDAWHQMWVDTATSEIAVPRRPPPRTDPAIVDTNDPVPATAFANENPEDLRRLARLLTPSWFAGPTHFGLDVVTPLFPKPGQQRKEPFVRGDEVLDRLYWIRRVYEGLPFVRRALANVPTYMMFDDHEISDDWNIERDWVERVRGRSLGRDVLRNALTAYVLCQDLGNDPARYEVADSPHRHVLDAIRALFYDDNTQLVAGPRLPAVEELEKRFGIAPLGAGGLPAETIPNGERMFWHYTVDGPGFQVIVLDNRTARGYESHNSVPSNLSAHAIANQIPRDPPPGDSESHITFVVAPIPVFGFPPIEQIGQPFINLLQQFRDDARRRRIEPFPQLQKAYHFGRILRDPEHWGLTPPAQERLLARLANRRRVVFMSGDVHYSLTMKATYWQLDPLTGNVLRDAANRVISTRFIQLTSSAALKEEGTTLQLYMHMSLAQQLGMVISGPFYRFAWRPPTISSDTSGTEDESLPPAVSGDWPDPWLQAPPDTKFPPSVYRRMTEDPAVIPFASLPEGTCTLRPPHWAWKLELMKDNRDDAIRLAELDPPMLPTEQELVDEPGAALRAIANRQLWHARSAVTRSVWLAANICTITFRDTDVTLPDGTTITRRELVHTIWAHDPRDLVWDAPRPYLIHVVPVTPIDPSDPQIAAGTVNTAHPMFDQLPTIPRCP